MKKWCIVVLIATLVWSQLGILAPLADTSQMYIVTFNVNGGSPIDQKTVEIGGLVDEPNAPTNDSYVFDGWYKEEDLINHWNFATDTVTDNITLYAKWIEPSGFTTQDNIGGTVTVTGYTGTMPTDLEIPSMIDNKTVTAIGPAAFYNKVLQKVTIPSTVKQIGDGAFATNELIEVTFEQGSELTTIGIAAFSGSKIQSITIPATVQKIENATFQNNSELTTVNFEAGSVLTEIGPSAFKKSKLQSITIPATVQKIEDSAFAENSELAAITFEAGSALTEIGSSAFWLSDLRGITIPAAVQKIGNSAFRSNKLATVSFEPDAALKEIGDYAFISNQLSGIMIPSKVKKIGELAFQSNPLTSLTFEPNSELAEIKFLAFSHTKLKAVVFPASLQKVGMRAFEYSLLENIEFQQPTTPPLIIDENAFNFQNNGATTNWYVNGDEENQWTGSNITTAFKMYSTPKQLHEVVFETDGGSPVVKGKVASGNLVTKPSSPTKTNYTFDGWYQDEQLQIPWDFALDTVTASITLYAKWSPFSTTDNGNGTLKITGYQGQVPSNLIIPSQFDGKNVTIIGKESFWSKGLTSVTIPSGVTKIEETAFTSNQLTSVSIPSSVESIGSGSFSNNKLVNVEISHGVTHIGNIAFNTNQLTKVVIPSSVTTIENGAFAYNKLKKVVFEGNVPTIVKSSIGNQSGTFSDWYTDAALTTTWNGTVPLAMEIYSVVPRPMYTVTFNTNGGSDITPKEMEEGEFIVKPSDPTKDSYTFDGWYQDEQLQIPWSFATDSVTMNITLYAKWSPFTAVDNGDGTIKITGYSGTVPAELVIPTEINGKSVKVIGMTAFMFQNLTSIVIPEGVKTIETSAFSGNQLTSIVIPSTVEGIESTAFKGNKLEQVEFKGTVSTIDGSVFGGQRVTPEFTGWYTDRSMQPSALWDETVPQAMTIYSVGFPKYTVTFNTNGGSAIAPKSVAQGEGITAPTAPTRAGYTFAGWYKDSTLQIAWNFGTDKVTETTTLYAKWNAVLTPNPNPPFVPDSTPSTTNQIRVDVVDASNPNAVLVQTVITRDTSNGVVKDTVNFTSANARESIEKLTNQVNKKSRIVIPDAQQQVSETTVGIAREAARLLAEGQAGLGIDMETVKFDIPASSLANFDTDFYFRVVPVKAQTTKQQLEERAKAETSVQQFTNNATITLLGQPMTIETNMQNRPVTLTLPLPQNVTQEQLDNLAVYIEHSDGTKEVVRGKLVDFKAGIRGIEFEVTKFSTFSILYAPVKQEQPKEEVVVEEQISTPYIKGYADGTFRPEASVTRAQMASMLARYLTDNEIPEGTATFIDTVKHDAKDAIEFVKETGLFKGTTATTFNPNGSITRAQMATVVARWLAENGEVDSSQANAFKDVSKNHWAAEAIAVVSAQGIMTGTSTTTFNPEGYLTRAQAVKVLNRLFERQVTATEQTPLFTDVPSNHWAFDEIQAAAQ
ncbi:leucine-rich repeat protein [Lysinibacillus piscis]|uniref:SLH domain-containing protein n=1 Tax=Lysinibacillus piscis TaxID=2518931 RepID=A0ABQ5NPB8_9BACI|nr:leucine-rich repeat protein [Lysinibacillus sp. KH24]GLC90167.1 hypothetical protein LYSBPC_32940 [Lysinibacillus sp. KH24]